MITQNTRDLLARVQRMRAPGMTLADAKTAHDIQHHGARITEQNQQLLRNAGYTGDLASIPSAYRAIAAGIDIISTYLDTEGRAQFPNGALATPFIGARDYASALHRTSGVRAEDAPHLESITRDAYQTRAAQTAFDAAIATSATDSKDVIRQLLFRGSEQEENGPYIREAAFEHLCDVMLEPHGFSILSEDLRDALSAAYLQHPAHDRAITEEFAGTTKGEIALEDKTMLTGVRTYAHRLVAERALNHPSNARDVIERFIGVAAYDAFYQSGERPQAITNEEALLQGMRGYRDAAAAIGPAFHERIAQRVQQQQEYVTLLRRHERSIVRALEQDNQY